MKQALKDILTPILGVAGIVFIFIFFLPGYTLYQMPKFIKELIDFWHVSMSDKFGVIFILLVVAGICEFIIIQMLKLGYFYKNISIKFSISILQIKQSYF